MPTHFFKDIILGSLFNSRSVPYTDRESGTAFQDAAIIFKGNNVVGIYRYSFVDGEKTGIKISFSQEFRHGHAASYFFAVCQHYVKVMGIRDNRTYFVRQDADRFPALCQFQIFWRRGECFQGVCQHIKDTLSGEGLGDIFKSVAGKGIGHEFPAGGQEDKEAAAVQVPQLQGGGNSVHFLHVDIHKDNGKASCFKSVKKSPAV